MNKPVHPNLARIASIYDSVVLARRGGHITETDAYARIDSLVAKDDFGVEWSISPQTGEWRYRDKWGEYYYAQPPEYGIVSATPYDMESGNTTYHRVSLYPVDEATIGNEHAAPGTTLGLEGEKSNTKYVYGALVCVVCACIGLYSIFVR